MFYIVGLGNPGVEYEQTRHNLGWWVLDALVLAWQLPPVRRFKKIDGDITDGLIGSEEVTLLYPRTFMNNSGLAVRKLVPKGAYQQLIVIYDDADLPQGEIKISFGSGAGGHNGVASIIASLGTKDFIRVRVGIAPKPEESDVALRPAGATLSDYVIGRVSAIEAKLYTDALPRIVAAVETIIGHGYLVAMNKFN